jgi:hypothetical protein
MSEPEYFNILAELSEFLPDSLANIVLFYVVIPCPFCDMRIFYFTEGDDPGLLCDNCQGEFSMDDHLETLPDDRVRMDCPMCLWHRAHTILGDRWINDYRGRFYEYTVDFRCDCGYKYQLIVEPEEWTSGSHEKRVTFRPICAGCPSANYRLEIGKKPNNFWHSLCSKCEAEG